MKQICEKAGFLVLAAALALVVHGDSEASVMTWRPPVIKAVTAAPAKGAIVGRTVSIRCVVGAEENLQLDTNSPQGRYLAAGRRPSWTLPVQIRVNNRKIADFYDAGMSSLSATSKHFATWKPSAADAGKPAVIECVVDPDKKLFFSSKTVQVPVLLKPIPRVQTKDQPAPAMKAAPPSAVPSPPKR